MRFDLSDSLTAAVAAVFLSELENLGQGVGDAIRTVDQFATVDSVSGTNMANLPFLSNVPSLRPFEGERAITPATGGLYTIPIRNHESTISFPRDAFQSELTPGVEAKIRDFARSFAREKVRLGVSVLANGTATNTYDGQPLLSTTRGNLTNQPLTLNSLQSAISALMSFATPDGQPYRRVPTHLIVGPKLYLLAKQLTMSAGLVTGENATIPSSNPVGGMLEVLLAHDLIGAYDDYWFVADLSGVRPVVHVERSDMPDELIVRSDPQSSDAVFMRDEVLVGLTSRFGIGAGAWYSVYAGIL